MEETEKRVRSTQPQPPLAVADLACRRGDTLLFKGLAFRVEAGRMAWIRGRNGRGKTSLLKLAAGLSTPDQGQVLRDGRDLVYIGHANALNGDLSVGEALAFLLRLHGRPAGAADVLHALGRLGMQGRRHAAVRTLSQGQRRRVALARLALEDRPSLWLLDEPFDALDAEGTRELNQLLQAHLQRGGAVVLSSHAGLDADLLQPAEVDLDRYG